jgi:uncharacterized protein (TIGR03085 family)
MSSPARAERAELCDLFLELGPDQPTLCGGWTTRDLAAHLVIRERRPDAAIGILSTFFEPHSEKVRLAERERPWTEIVERVRSGPPSWNPMHLGPIDAATNTVEFFVHHEDVRRAQAGWTPRPLTLDLEDALAGMVRRGGGMLTRRAKVGIVVAADGRPPMRLHKGPPVVTISGPIAECVLYVYGRKGAAQVTMDGAGAAIAKVAAAPFGI